MAGTKVEPILNRIEAVVLDNHSWTYGDVFFELLDQKGITAKQIAEGICDKRIIFQLRNKMLCWRKIPGDILMQRMGIVTDYFEIMETAEELERWRAREDICIAVCEEPKKAKKLVASYRNCYSKRHRLEEQFLLKAEGVCLLSDRDCLESKTEYLLSLAEQAVSQTVPEGYGANFFAKLLAPAELEAFLMLALAYLADGKQKEARHLVKQVWHYPENHGWESRMKAQILPQAALVGMQVLKKEDNILAAFQMGKTAFEVLQKNNLHRYVLPLLEALCQLAEKGISDDAFVGEIREYRQVFADIYQEYQCPGMRIWQTISVSNTQETGAALRIWRKARGLTLKEAGKDGDIVTERHLHRIEQGKSRPSRRTMEMLMEQYGCEGMYTYALAQTDSLRVLSLRQDIDKLIENFEWNEAEEKIETFKALADMSSVCNHQNLLVWNAILQWKKYGMRPEQVLGLFRQALSCTLPDFEVIFQKKYWVYRRMEERIVCNMAAIYGETGQKEKALQLFRQIFSSEKELRKRCGMTSWNYSLWADSFTDLLDDMERYETSMEYLKQVIPNVLWEGHIQGLMAFLYKGLCEAYKLAGDNKKNDPVYHSKWKKKLHQCRILAEMYDGKDFINSYYNILS